MLIEINDLTRKYTRGQKEIIAVDKLSLTADKGEFLIIKGESGSGKSTLLSMLAGLLNPTEGTIHICGENIYELSDKQLSLFRNRHIGYIPQAHELLSELTVYENTLLPYRLYGKISDEIHKRVGEILNRFGIGELKNSYPSDLSGGERKRAAIARALVNSPDVLLADEPTSDLDRKNTIAVLDAFTDIAKGGTTVIMITHEEHISSYGDRVIELENGKIKKGEVG